MHRGLMRHSVAWPLAILMGLVSVSLMPALGAPGASGPPGSQEALLAELMARSPGTMLETRASDSPGSSVNFVFGDLWPAQFGGPLATGQGFLDRYGSLFGFPRGFSVAQELRLMSRHTIDGGEILALAPAVGAVPYMRGKIVMRFDAAGRLRRFSGRYTNLGQVETGSLDAAGAVRIALGALEEHLGDEAISSDGSVREILDDEADGRIHQHYEVLLVEGMPGRMWQVLLGARGEVLSIAPASDEDGIHEATVQPCYPRPCSVRRILGPLWYDAGRGLYILADQNFMLVDNSSNYPTASSPTGNFDYPPYTDGAATNERDGLTGEDLNLDPQFLETQCYDLIATARERARAWGATEVDDHCLMFDVWLGTSMCPVTGGPPDATVPCRQGNPHKNNAFFSSADMSIHYYTYNPRFATHAGYDPSITFHEFGHYVQWCLNPDWSSPVPDCKHGDARAVARYLESKAVGEGWADFFSASITGESELGLIYFGPRSKALRSTVNDLTYVQVKNCTKSGLPCAPTPHGPEIHAAGQAFSGACWQLRQALGGDAAVRIVIAALRDAQTPTSFQDAATQIVVEATSADAASGKAARDIFRSRGMLPAGW